MLRLASINLNKRLSSQSSRARLRRWLEEQRATMLLAQEPWRNGSDASTKLAEFAPIGGNEKTYSWIDCRFDVPPIRQSMAYYQRLDLGCMSVYSVYLDAYDQMTRATQLTTIRREISTEGDRPVVVVGDFNIAPSRDDGLYNGEPSQFNSEIDREPLRRLQREAALVDLAACAGNRREWTVERSIQNVPVRFRCDLILVSDYIAPDIGMHVDHSVRTGATAFTDHSGILLDLPITPLKATRQFDLFAIPEVSRCASDRLLSYSPHKTAMGRTRPSPFAEFVVSSLSSEIRIQSILDYGCGRGEDVRFYGHHGFNAIGFDPHPGFGSTNEPTGTFDVVLLLFVLNVLASPQERINTLRAAARYVADGGVLIVAARSPSEIEQEAASKGWTPFNDGYWSHETKGTFQKGISRDEIIRLARRVGLDVSSLDKHRPLSAASSSVILKISTT